MAITFSCNSCGNKLRVAEEYAGKRAKCPSCKTVLSVPAASAPPQADTPPRQPNSNSGPAPIDFSGLGQHEPESHPHDEVPDFGGLPSTNPYQAPAYTQPARQNPASRKSGGRLNHQVVDFGEAFSQGMARYQKQIGMGALFALIMIGIGVANWFIGQVISVGFSLAGLLPLIIVGLIIVQLLQFCTQAYTTSIGARFGLNVATNREPLDRVFEGKAFLPLLFVYFLYMLVLFLVAAFASIPAIIALVSQQPEPEPFFFISFGIGFVLVIAVAVFCLRYALYPFFAVDQGVGTFKSLEMSAKYMKGNKLTLFLLFLVIGAIAPFAILLTCCIGLFFVLPLIQTVYAVFYLKATGQYQTIR